MDLLLCVLVQWTSKVCSFHIFFFFGGGGVQTHFRTPEIYPLWPSIHCFGGNPIDTCKQNRERERLTYRKASSRGAYGHDPFLSVFEEHRLDSTLTDITTALFTLYYLILWNQVDILKKHFKKDHVHMRLWTSFYGMWHHNNTMYWRPKGVYNFSTLSLN